MKTALHIYCASCGYAWDYLVKEENFIKWKLGELEVKEAFPEIPQEIREVLVSGKCGNCNKGGKKMKIDKLIAWLEEREKELLREEDDLIHSQQLKIEIIYYNLGKQQFCEEVMIKIKNGDFNE